MTAKLTASADGSKVLIGNAAEDALEIDATAKTIKALSPYVNLPRIPICRMSNAGQLITQTATATKMELPTKEIDIGSMADSVNHRVKPTIAGYYRITGWMYVEKVAAIGQLYVQLWKNGARIVWGTGSFPDLASDEKTSIISTLAYMNGTTDYIELYMSVESTSLPITSTRVFLEVELVSLP